MVRGPGGDPDVKARSLASLSLSDGPVAVLFPSSGFDVFCDLDLPGATNVGGPLRRATIGSAGLLCSSTRARGACLI